MRFLAIAAVLVAGGFSNAFGSEVAVTPVKPPVPEVVPHAKLVKAVKARDNARAQVRGLRYQLRQANKLVGLVNHPTPAGNRELAKRYFGAEYGCAAKIIEGESGWNERVWNRQGSGAYGLGQARPRSKMLAYGGDAYTNPLTQMIWMTGYADGRFGGICPAAAQWTVGRSW